MLFPLSDHKEPMKDGLVSSGKQRPLNRGPEKGSDVAGESSVLLQLQLKAEMPS